MKRAKQIIFIILMISTAMVVLPGPLLWAETPPSSKNAASSKTKALGNKDQLVSIDFNNVDIGIFIKFISDLTKTNFVIDERVKGKVTIISPGKITVTEAYRVFESVLEVHGYATVPSGQITKIVSLPDARSKSIKTRLREEGGMAGDSVVTQIIPLRYADPNEIKKLFTPLVSKSSVILSYPPTNTLIITDIHSNIKRLMRILKAIDITGVGQQIAILPVEYADAAKLVTLLKSVFSSRPKKGKGSVSSTGTTFVADERTNVIVVLASEGDTERIRQLVKILDQETPRGAAKINVYYLEHAKAEELAAVLKDIPQGSKDKKKGGKKTAPVISDDVRISADKATNSLIIMADTEDYATLEQIIRKIDIPRAMVYIEALIMEVNVEKDFRLGTEWLIGDDGSYESKEFIGGGGWSGGATGGDPGYTALGPINAATGNDIPALAPGFSLGLFGESISISGITFPTIGAIFQAYKKDDDVRILSTPQILTTDNQEAKIYVGKNVPFQTKVTTTGSSDTFNSFEYRDVGRSLTITPSISIDRMVRLEISLESTELEGVGSLQPTTLKRTVDTTAIVKDQHTVVLGGLIDDTSTSTSYKVPCLGDIPGLSVLFSSKARGNDKTNLYIFLTPKVIQSPAESTAIYKKKRRQIDALRKESNIKLYNDDPPVQPETYEAPVPESSSGTDQAPATASTIASAAPAAAVITPADAAPPAVIAASAPADAPAPTEAADPVTTAAPAPEMPAGDTAQPIPPPAQTPAPAPAPQAATDNAQGFTIQVASVNDKQRADKVLKALSDKGYAAYTVQSTVDGQTWYRLRVGYFATAESAENLLSKLRADDYKPLLIQF